MPDVAPTGPTITPAARFWPTNPPSPPTDPSESAARRTFDTDAVDLSAAARFRPELVARVRAEIDAGTYETNAKLDVAVDRLAIDLTA